MIPLMYDSGRTPNVYSACWFLRGSSTFPVNCNVPLAYLTQLLLGSPAFGRLRKRKKVGGASFPFFLSYILIL